MSDKISIIYDANIDDLKTKLEVLIDKNNQLKIAAAGASRAISDMTAAKKDFGSKIAITTKNITDNSISIRTNTKNIQENTLSISSSTRATQNNTSVVNTATNSYNSYSSAVNNASSASGGFKASTNLLTRAFQMLTARMVAFFAIDSMVSFGKELVNVERKFEILQNRINFVAGTTTGGEAIFSRLQRTANDLGIGIEELTNGFSGFAIAAKMAGFSSATAEDIFSKVATSLRAAGANSLQTQRAFYALQQMLSKGVVAAEELRRQLGEALPGASDLMTRAYNRLHPGQELTNRQFTKMLEEGKIISAEILPEFARVLEQEFAPALSGKKNSLDAILTRISNQFIAFKMNLSNLDFLKNTFNGLALFLEDINNVMTNEELSFSETVDGLMRAGTRFNQFEIEQQKKLASQGSFLAKYYLSGQKVLEESAEKAKKRVEQQAKNEAILLKNAEKQYEAYKKLNEIEQSRLETSLQMRITLSDKDIAELSTESKAIRDLYDEIGKTVGITSEKWNMYAEAGAKVVKQELRNAMSAKGLWNITKKELDAVNSFDKRLKQKTEENKLFVKSTKAAQEQDKALSDLIKTRRVADAQGGPAGQGGADPQKEAIAAAKERIALEETLLLKTTEGTAAYYAQLIKVIEARKDLVKLEKAGTPKQMGLDIAKLDKDLNNAKQMITSFTPEMADIVEEGVYVPSVEALERLSKDIKDLTKQQLEDRAAAIQTEIQFHEEGTDRRLELEKALVMAKAKLAAKEAEIQGKTAKEIEAIFAKANIDIADLDKKFYDKKREEAEKYADFYKRLQDGLDGYEGNSLQKRLKAIREYYGKLIAEAKVYGRTKEEIDALDAERDKAILNEKGQTYANTLSGIGGLFRELNNVQKTLNDNELNDLQRQLDKKLITEEQYEQKVAEIKKKQFQQDKQAAIAEALLNIPLAILQGFRSGGAVGGAIAAIAAGAQLAAIQAAQPPAFKDGVIDLQGPGTGTSDSIHARLSRGESVMTAKETAEYKPVLQAIRDGEFEAFIAKRYADSMRKQDGSGKSGDSFAENIVNAFDLQSAEIINAIGKNKRVKIDNVKELAGAIFPNTIRHRATSKKLN